MMVEPEERRIKLKLDMYMHNVGPPKSQHSTYSQRLLDQKCVKDTGLISFVLYIACGRPACLQSFGDIHYINLAVDSKAYNLPFKQSLLWSEVKLSL